MVVDGLALDQWVSIRQLLQTRDSSLAMRESAIFVKTPTCHSRGGATAG
ncbi:MAG: hypothetical protein PHG44_01415 [Lentisphaeria bacterium]|nr:hypothetical protein [Lentisphaeria bacterium]